MTGILTGILSLSAEFYSRFLCPSRTMQHKNNWKTFKSLLLPPLSVGKQQNSHSLVTLLIQQMKSLLCHLHLPKISFIVFQ